MNYTLVVDSELLKLSIPDRFFEYAESYGNGAKALAEKMVFDKDEATWPNAAVVLMLSAHSVELFMKGAIFKFDSKAKIGNHNIDALLEKYCQTYREERYYFDMPFKTEYPGMSEEEIEALKENKRPTPSVLYRYPTETGESEWKGSYGFEASSFLPIISGLLQDYRRLRKCFT
mgnify:FL=1